MLAPTSPVNKSSCQLSNYIFLNAQKSTKIIPKYSSKLEKNPNYKKLIVMKVRTSKRQKFINKHYEYLVVSYCLKKSLLILAYQSFTKFMLLKNRKAPTHNLRIVSSFIMELVTLLP